MFRTALGNTTSKRFNSTFNFRRWAELNTGEKQRFVTDFVENYKRQYPGSKTNVSLKGLAMDMEKHNDAPSVFGIFYNDIWEISKARKESIYGSGKHINRNDLIKDYGRFGHETFHELLID
ncbi:unnamed protein product [Kluyveromyces dobzhanskii CBS 2104]|uniref:WGS project CCBQ000000000 data, contig 00041 n=1 Tax=Kluyveromyces dobzhanskii CBS 2104 TaxID=1427455 RepID=A0A0A8L080_9SACH|nr:unnamed protein product [Kluyveromyces dobzhanskii CBS 2104]